MKKGISIAVRERVKEIEAVEGASFGEVLVRLHGDGMSYHQIQQRWKLGHYLLNRLMAECGLERNGDNTMVRRIERSEGCEVGEALRRHYVDECMTYRQLCERWKIQPRTLIRLMQQHSVEARQKSEAVKLQWVGNDARREATSMRMRQTVSKLNAEGKHTQLGKTKKNCPEMADFYTRFIAAGATIEARQKGGATRKKVFAECPYKHANAKVAPTERERMMLQHCQSVGYQIQFNHNVCGYWIDVFLPELGIGIECVNGKRPTWERHKTLTNNGIHMLYITNAFIDTGDFRQVDAYLSDYNATKTSPDFRIQDAIVWGSSYAFFFAEQPCNVILQVLREPTTGLHCIRYSEVA